MARVKGGTIHTARRKKVLKLAKGYFMNDISYSKFIDGLNKAGVTINRKMLSEIAIQDEKAFTQLVMVAKDGLAGKTAPKAEPKKETEQEDISKKSVAELREMAKNAAIEGYASMKKAELLDALK